MSLPQPNKAASVLAALIGVCAVDIAGFLDGLTARGGAAEAVHADAEKELSGLGVLIKNVADN